MTTERASEEQKTERFNMFLSPSELNAIEDWAWANRIRSKSDALRRLAAIALALDNDSQALTKALSDLWRIQQIGTEAILAELGGEPDWKNVAKKALATISEMLEPQTALSERLFAVLHQTALLKTSGDLRDGLVDAEKIKIASEERALQIAAAFSEAEENS